MRDDAFAQLGDTDLSDLTPQGSSPTFEVTSVEEEPNPGQIARRVKGNFMVPCYLFPNCGPGGTMQLDSNGAPIQNGVWTANFDCIIPVSVASGPAGAGRPSLYGHGLFGNAGEVASGPQRQLAQEHGIVFCATDEIGMSESDVPVAIGALQELSRFPALPDRLQQGLLDEMYPRPGDDQRRRVHDRPRLPPGRDPRQRLGARHQPPLLQRQQPGRDHGRRPDRGDAGLHPRLARRAGDELLGTAAALGRLRPVRRRPLSLLSGRTLAAAGARPDPDALGPRRPERLREPDDRRPAAGHSGPPGAVGRRLRRPPGDRLPGRRRGADGRRPRPPAGPLRRPLARHQRPLAGAGDPALPIHRLGGLLLGHRADPRRTGRDHRRHRTAALREQPNRSGADPHGAPRATPAEQQLVSDFFEGAIPESDNCGGGPCFAIGFSGP